MSLSGKTMNMHDDPRFPRVWRKHPVDICISCNGTSDRWPDHRPWAGKRQFVGSFDTWEHAIGMRVVDGKSEYGGSPVWQRIPSEWQDATWVLLWPCQCGVWTSDPAAHDCSEPAGAYTGVVRSEAFVEQPPCSCSCHWDGGATMHVVACCYPGYLSPVFHLKHRIEIPSAT